MKNQSDLTVQLVLIMSCVVTLAILEFELYNDDETWLPHSGCTPVALPCFLVTHKTRPAAINVARAV